MDSSPGLQVQSCNVHVRTNQIGVIFAALVVIRLGSSIIIPPGQYIVMDHARLQFKYVNFKRDIITTNSKRFYDSQPISFNSKEPVFGKPDALSLQLVAPQ